MKHEVRDTKLYISKKVDRCYVHTKTKRDKPVMRPNGACVVRTVSKEEMKKLWK